MKINLGNIKKYLLAHKAISIIGAIVIISIASYSYSKIKGGSTTTQYVFGKVTRGDLIQTVSGTGQVATLSQVDIKPQTVGQSQTLGQIVYVNVQNGDFVKTGQTIAVLDGKNALQALNQAKASVAIAQANYNKLVNGPTESDLNSLNESIQNSENSIENTKQNIQVKMKSAYIAASTAVYINTDQFFSGIESGLPNLNSINGVAFTSQDLETQLRLTRASMGTVLQGIKDRANNESSSTDFISDLNQTISDLNKISDYFGNMTSLFSNYSVAGFSSAQTVLNADKIVANSAESSINSSISDLTTVLQTYKGQLLSLEQNKNSLSLKTATPSDNDTIVLKSNLDNAEANMENALSNYESRIIRAPFNGQIGGLNAQIGMQVSSNDSLGKIITQDRVVNITLNEVDVAKVNINNPVTLTFDALPELSIVGKIQYIDPLGVVTQGVVNYNVRVLIGDKSESIKTGMTASAEIQSETHKNVLLVPSSAIKTVGNRKYVLVSDTPASTSTFNSSSTINFDKGSTTRMLGSSTRRMKDFSFASSTLTENNLKQVEVMVGISNGIDTEILSGLEEGQTIVTKTTAGKTTTAAAASGASANPFAKITGGGGQGARALSR